MYEMQGQFRKMTTEEHVSTTCDLTTFLHILQKIETTIFLHVLPDFNIIENNEGPAQIFSKRFVQIKNSVRSESCCHGNYSRWRRVRFFCQMTTSKSVKTAGALHRIRISRNDANFFSSNEKKNTHKKNTSFITNRQIWRWKCLVNYVVILRPKRA